MQPAQLSPAPRSPRAAVPSRARGQDPAEETPGPGDCRPAPHTGLHRFLSAPPNLPWPFCCLENDRCSPGKKCQEKIPATGTGGELPGPPKESYYIGKSLNAAGSEETELKVTSDALGKKIERQCEIFPLL